MASRISSLVCILGLLSILIMPVIRASPVAASVCRWECGCDIDGCGCAYRCGLRQRRFAEMRDFKMEGEKREKLFQELKKVSEKEHVGVAPQRLEDIHFFNTSPE